jgi:hypothetical protein
MFHYRIFGGPEVFFAAREMLQSVANCFSRGLAAGTVADCSQTVAIRFKPQEATFCSPFHFPFSRRQR